MNNTIKDRLIAIAAHYKVSANKFSLTIGKSRSYIQNMKNDVSSEVLKNILVNYPDVDARWLITGEGSLINESFLQQSKEIEKLRKIILDQADQITLLREVADDKTTRNIKSYDIPDQVSFVAEKGVKLTKQKNENKK